MQREEPYPPLCYEGCHALFEFSHNSFALLTPYFTIPTNLMYITKALHGQIKLGLCRQEKGPNAVRLGFYTKDRFVTTVSAQVA